MLAGLVAVLGHCLDRLLGIAEKGLQDTLPGMEMGFVAGDKIVVDVGDS